SYSLNAESRLSLDNWVYYQTRRNHDLRKFLSEWGFRSLSNWALLNRVGTKQLELLLDRDRYLIETFHAVYRRDRRYQQRRHDVRRCPDPTTDQLKEMSHLLQERGIILKSPSQLKEELQRVAQLLQDYDVWNRRGSPLSMPLETPDPDTEDRTERDFADPRSINDLNELEQSEFLEFIRQQLMEILEESIEQVLNEYITSLKQRSRYASLASKVIPGLRLIYCQGLSQKEIASRLGMTNQSKVSRVLNQQNLLNQVRLRTVEKLSSIILERVQTLELANLAAEPNYLRNLWHHLEGFLDEEVFQQAAAEIRTANNRSMNSLYAQRLRCYIEKHKE
ncbi:MAG: hypothetical protein LDL41_10370, partial [Coleofasciculus sp. S288]|nr:hypothetical protein [Coleofasciculus sp. S288]